MSDWNYLRNMKCTRIYYRFLIPIWHKQLKCFNMEARNTPTLNSQLIHWGRVTHVCIRKLSTFGRRQDIIWTNAGISLILTLRTNFCEILSEIHKFLFKKMHLKMSGKWRPFCLGVNEIIPMCVGDAMSYSFNSPGIHLTLLIYSNLSTRGVKSIFYFKSFWLLMWRECVFACG